MKFSVSSSALLSLLATTGKVISNKNTLPILDYFLMELNGNELKVTTSDLETTLIGSITVDSVESEGTIAAPAKLMLDSLKEFSELPLTIDVNDKNWEIRINWKSGSLSIPGASAVSYPAVPQLSAEKKELKLNVDTLVNGINKTIFATADDELRPVMNGIYINLTSESFTFVGTDAHKLVKYEAEAENGEVNASFILPKKPANLLKSVLLKEDDAIEVSFDSKNALFKLKSHTLVCRLIEGNYPNYNAVIPANNPNKVLVDRIELVNGIKRVAVCSNPTTNLIRMDIGDNKINLTAQDIDFSVSANETISCSYDGEEITIGFKSTFLVEILSNMDTPTVVVELADSTRAGVFKPVYDDKQTSATLMLLMPMMINA
ncbi:DNA polymerase III subunit beta [uncultured Alistipes sp.]|jgi:DNA polymerase-3 subunit beta|uniref:DNA polymerase III subunit beta n=1 Tax=Alistipes sp. TaxID=1872444 RepID=UPI0025F014A3|nr:DNA polymerase III subunit beta [uncultured Alistipes sp.]